MPLEDDVWTATEHLQVSRGREGTIVRTRTRATRSGGVYKLRRDRTTRKSGGVRKGAEREGLENLTGSLPYERKKCADD